jgi:hypothetical protein
MGEVSKQCGIMWKQASEEEKQAWKDKASALKNTSS